MSNYIQDPDDSKKQIPGSLPDNAYDRGTIPTRCMFTKTPNYIIVNSTLVGFLEFGL